MIHPIVAPYGSWKSPITSDQIVASTVGLGQIALDGSDIYWVEARPTEGGRMVIVRLTSDGEMSTLTPQPFNVRSRVHEYGGGSFTAHRGVVYFSNFADGRLYRQTPGRDPIPITPEAAFRYADLMVDAQRQRLICVREDHSTAGREAVNTLVTVSLPEDAAGGQMLVSGNDFYASPRLSPDGQRLAWLTWNHPNMPWDGAELWVGDVLASGAIGNAQRVAGGPEESIFQPEWSPDGLLYFVSDRTGWWNLYRLGKAGIEALTPMAAEFGRPQWVFGLSTYAFESAERLICAYTRDGIWYLALLNPATRALTTLDLPFTEFSGISATAGQAVFIAGGPATPTSLARLFLDGMRVDILRRSSALTIETGYLSVAQAIAFPTQGGLIAHALFYPPQNRDYTAPAGEKPPLLVMSHGGPTGATSSTLSLKVQYWTSRGFAVLDVNYGGSTGYGRAYRERLNGQWGVVDVDDCVNGARYLVERGMVDGSRLAITGGSAGGYTTLCALTFRALFRAGASHFGICDLEALARETHKFEAHYTDRLIGPYPERRDLYRARSPIHFTDRLSCPIILFQGLDDRVVPPSQAEAMYAAVRAKGLPVAYLAFEGEGHGFRRAENIKRSLDAEFYFYARIFGFEPGERVEQVPIENLPHESATLSGG